VVRRVEALDAPTEGLGWCRVSVIEGVEGEGEG
jgi:hypothetical protein